jgi:omega-6 fatty acid desaturase (delta-12 desaturase)
MEPSVELYRLVSKYRKPDTKKAVIQVLDTFVPCIVINALAYVSYLNAMPLAFTLSLSVIAGLFVVRIFIIQHDCGHESFLKSRYWNNTIGLVCSFFTLTPYYFWRRSHNVHHANSGNLDKRFHIGEVYTLTTDEYKKADTKTKVGYRVYRNWAFLFFIGSFVYFTVLNRIPDKYSKQWVKERANVHITTILLLLISAMLIYMFGIKTFLIVQLPIIYVGAVVGTALFYFQHQFEDTYWEHDDKWKYEFAALKGSSYFKMNPVFQWLSGNIGFHHIHHLSPAIPNYNLEKAYKENQVLRNVTTLTWKNCYKATKLGLWSEQKDNLVKFSEA